MTNIHRAMHRQTGILTLRVNLIPPPLVWKGGRLYWSFYIQMQKLLIKIVSVACNPWLIMFSLSNFWLALKFVKPCVWTDWPFITRLIVKNWHVRSVLCWHAEKTIHNTLYLCHTRSIAGNSITSLQEKRTMFNVALLVLWLLTFCSICWYLKWPIWLNR